MVGVAPVHPGQKVHCLPGAVRQKDLQGEQGEHLPLRFEVEAQVLELEPRCLPPFCRREAEEEEIEYQLNLVRPRDHEILREGSHQERFQKHFALIVNHEGVHLIHFIQCQLLWTTCLVLSLQPSGLHHPCFFCFLLQLFFSSNPSFPLTFALSFSFSQFRDFSLTYYCKPSDKKLN